MTSNSSSLYLNNNEDVYKLHPVVVFSILDSYKRRPDKLSRVIGTLLGERIGNEVYIRESFPIPFTEKEEQLTLDMAYHDTMVSLHRRVNPKLQIVGWFSTGDKIVFTSTLIHDEYQSRNPDAVLLMVDTSLKNHKMSIKTFRGKTIKSGDKSFLTRFLSAPMELYASEAEKIGVDAIINGHPETNDIDAPATIMSELDSLETSLRELTDMIDQIVKYTERVTRGEIQGDPEVGRMIAQALAAVPAFDQNNFDKLFTNSIQDILMIYYLAELTRTQLALSDKINGMVQ